MTDACSRIGPGRSLIPGDMFLNDSAHIQYPVDCSGSLFCGTGNPGGSVILRSRVRNFKQCLRACFGDRRLARPGKTMRRAVNWFSVRVPVLSEQIVVAEPKVSTEDRRRINALRLIISRIPNARLMVTTAGSPSGTAAIARLTEMMNISSGS